MAWAIARLSMPFFVFSSEKFGFLVYTHLYLFELKLGKSADAAMKQIDLKEYPKRFALCGLPVVKVGINFDVEKHTLADWMVEEA